jgi:hypothetical protein
MGFWDEPKYLPIETEDFLVWAGEYAGSVRHWDEIKDAFWRSLTNNPYIGVPAPGTPYHFQDLASDPPLTVYYQIDEDAKTVTFVGIYPMEPPQ